MIYSTMLYVQFQYVLQYCLQLCTALAKGKARQVYLYSTFHTQWQFKVLYIEEIKIIGSLL